MKKYLKKLHRLEAADSQNIDETAGCFGELMAQLLIYKEDMWQETMGRLGFFSANLFILWMHGMIWKKI